MTMYTLYGSQGSGAAVVEAALVLREHSVPQRRRRLVGARSRPRRADARESARADSHARAARRLGDDRERGDPRSTSGSRIPTSGLLPADASRRAQVDPRTRVHRGQLLRGHRHHRLSRALVHATPTTRRGAAASQAHRRRHAQAPALPVGRVRRHVSGAAVS